MCVKIIARLGLLLLIIQITTTDEPEPEAEPRAGTEAESKEEPEAKAEPRAEAESNEGPVAPPPGKKSVRQAPFCVKGDTHPELENFKPIIDYYKANPKEYIPVSANADQSRSGFIANFTLTEIVIDDQLLPEGHTWSLFDNFLHITIKAHEKSDGLEGIYIQAISGPIGVPFGEFVDDFDCGDCKHPSSNFKEYSNILGCAYRPAAAYLHPTIYSIGGKKIPPKFYEAHFNFKYVDYACYDVIYAQFLIVIVRKFNPPDGGLSWHEAYFSPIFKVDLEGIGAPSPMYYGWEKSDIECHDEETTLHGVGNWRVQKNSRVKIKFSEEYDSCVRGDSKAIEGLASNICKPGPVTCGAVQGGKMPPKTVSQWKRFRRKYFSQYDKEGTELFCYDCGEYKDHIGPGKTWGDAPKVDITQEQDVTTVEVINDKTIRIRPKKPKYKSSFECEERDYFGKTINGSRDVTKDRKECDLDFSKELTTQGWKWGQKVLKLHGLLMIFAFTVGTNCLIYCSRFLKEATVLHKDSGCWGIGTWIWDHLLWTYMTGAAMWGGFTLFCFPKVFIVCQVFDSKEATDYCLKYGFAHKVVGGFAVIIFHMSYISGWYRPKTARMRSIMIGYHAFSGYFAKYLGLISLALVPPGHTTVVIIILVLFDLCFWILFAVGTFVQRAIDKDVMEEGIRRKMLPVPEAMTIHHDPPMEKLRGLLFPLMILSQLGLFGGLFLHEMSTFKKKFS